MVKSVCEVQTSHPNAIPISSEIPKREKIKAIANGYAPKPPLVNPTASVPKIKPIITTSKVIVVVSGNANIVT